MPHWPIAWHKPSSHNLQNFLQFLEILGNPHKKLPPVIHVAGTNGKGSSVAYLRAIFEEMGCKVHAYTSPHLLDFNERIVLASEKITDEYLFAICERARLASEKSNITSLSFFEYITAAAFLAFAEIDADVLLLETGMGGRLDATNVVDNPILTIITEISYDHMDYLGPTLPLIAAEKAGIVKKHAPCAISLQMDEVYTVLFDICDQNESKSIAFGYDFGITKLDSGFNVLGIGDDDFVFSLPSLRGDHQIMNAATVIAGLRVIQNIPLDVINIALQKTVWPARIQQIHTTRYKNDIFIDGAHNSAGALALALWAQDNTPDVSIILGMTKNRNVHDFLLPFRGIARHVYCVGVKSEASSYTPERLLELGQSSEIPLSACASLDEALSLASNASKTTIVTGSLFLAADLLKLLGYA